MLALVTVAAGCYNPTIGTGDFSCGPQMQCPTGFSCMANQCLLPGQMAGTFTGNGSIKAPQELASLPKGSTIVADTRTGALIASDINGTVILTLTASGTGTPQVTTFVQPKGPKVVMWNFDSFTIPDGVILTTKDNAAIAAFGATGTITIAGTVDWSGRGGIGGFPGAASTVDTSFGVGKPAQPGDATGSGGGGGGYADAGSVGGLGGGAGGEAYGDSGVHTLYQGGGGGGGGDMASASNGGSGGAGGGGFALFAGEIDISGNINVNGLDGEAAASGNAGGGGGGAGGTISISADVINLQGSYSLTALGGGTGSGSGTGGSGGMGAVGRIWSAGKVSDINPLNASPMRTKATDPVVTFPRTE